MPFSPRNKDRLYIALYYHKRPGTYHWALHITPKPTSSSTHNNVKSSPTIGTRHHATNKLLPRGESGEIKSTWVAESHPLSDLDRGSEGAKLLVKVLIGKILTLGGREEVDECIAKVGVLQDNPEFTCRIWVREAVAQLAREGLLSDSSITDWEVIEAECRSYAQKKTDEGRFKTWTGTTPTYDLMTKKEVEL